MKAYRKNIHNVSNELDSLLGKHSSVASEVSGTMTAYRKNRKNSNNRNFIYRKFPFYRKKAYIKTSYIYYFSYNSYFPFSFNFKLNFLRLMDAWLYLCIYITKMILSAFPFCFTFKFNFLKRETEKQNTYTYTKEKRGALRRLYQPVLNFPFVTEIFTCKPKIDIEETKKQRLNTFNSKLIRDLIFFYRKVPVFSKMETLKSIFTFIPNFTFKSAISKRKSELLEEATNVLALKEFADLYRIKTPVVNRILVTYATKDVKAIKTIQQIHNSQNDYCTSEITKIEPIVFENVNRSSLMESPRLFKYFSAFKRLNKCLSVFHKFVSIMQFLFMETRKRHSWFSFHLR